MPASQEQKVDFLLKKIGYSASKTGIAEDSSLTGSTKKAPFAEAIPSPLIVPRSSVWSDSGFIPTTPPTSNTTYVGIYTAANAYRMTFDNTVGAARRSFIARSTYGNQTASIDGDWIDTQFGAEYIVKVYKGDPNSGGVSLQQAGGNAGTDGWFFDYSSGVLNFNGNNLPSGIGTDNVYILGYRYTGAKGLQPPAGIGTFRDLVVTNNFKVGGISTFSGLIDANGIIEGIAGQNKIPSLYANYSDLPNPGTYHGMFAHVHGTQKGYFAHAGGWYELVNKETTGTVGTGTERYNIGALDATSLKVTGITTLGSIGISTGRIIGPSVTYIDPATVGAAGTVVILGNLQVDGTQTTVNSSVMTVTDKNIEVAKGAANNAAADGAGITVDAGSNADKTWQWLDATDSWTSSEHIRIPDDKVFGFASDTNTYIGRPAADTFAFTQNGNEKVRISSIGVGINTDVSLYNGANSHLVVRGNNITSSSDNAVAVLHSGTAGIGQLRFTDGATGYHASQSWVQYDHNATKFTIGWNAQGRIFGGPNTELGLFYDSPSNLDSNAHELVIGGGTGSGGMTLFNSTSGQGNIFFADGIGSAADKKRGQIIYDHTNNSMQFATNNVEKVRIDTDGNTNIVGIVTALHFNYFDSGNQFSNILLGYQTGNANLVSNSSQKNILIGDRAGSGITTSSNNIMIGSQAGRYVNTGGGIYIGQNAGKSNNTGSNNVYVGGSSGSGNNHSGGSNTFVGTFTGIDRIGNSNSLFGYYAGRGTSGQTNDGDRLSFFGNQAGQKNTSGDQNSGFGHRSLVLNTTGNKNSGFGNETLVNSTGNYNSAFGADAGKNLTSGDNNLILGYNAQASTNSTSNEVTIGDANITKFRIPGIGVTFSTSGNRIPYSTTLTSDLNVSGNLKVVGVTSISTLTSGRVVYAGTSGKLQDSNNLRFDGTNLFVSGINVTNPGSGVTSILGVDIVTRNLKATGVSTFVGQSQFDSNVIFNSTISAGSTTGTDGYYLKSVGTGVTWAAFPSSRTGLTTTATAGQTTFNFSYNIGFVDVFVNGVKLPASEFTASNGSTIVLDDAAFANDTLEFISLNTLPVTSSGGAQNLTGLADVTISGTPVAGETLQHNGSVFVNDYTVTSTKTSTSQASIHSLAVATYRSVEYTIQITEGTKYHVTKILAIHDGTNVTFNEYGTLTTHSSLATFALDVNSGNMRLLATPASSNSTVFKVKFNAIKV